VWALIGVLALALIVVLLLTQRGRRKELSVDARRRLLESALGTWALQGWAIESQTADTAVLRRPGEQMLVSVDPYGSVTARPLPPAAPGR
jgi:type II secretory pathway pseudopilin PulG